MSAFIDFRQRPRREIVKVCHDLKVCPDLIANQRICANGSHECAAAPMRRPMTGPAYQSHLLRGCALHNAQNHDNLQGG
jgi:hypothetical protein